MLNNVESVVAKQTLCCSCGLCANYCHQGAITYRVDKLGFYIPVVDRIKCNNCGLCVKCCPGKNDLKQYKQQDESYLYGYSLDEEMHLNASSGGILTELLCYLIEKKKVSYVTCVTNRTDMALPEQILTNDIKTIRSSRTSKYCPVKWGDILSKIEKADGDVAVVALPCQINSLKKYYAHKKSNIKYYISLFCNHTPSLHAADYLVNSVIPGGKLLSIINRGEGFPGYMKMCVEDNQGREKNFKFPFRKIMKAGYGRFFKNVRCYVCNDPFAKNADVVMGDSYFLQDNDKKGTTFCIIRNNDIVEILHQMKSDGLIDYQTGPDEEVVQKAYKILFTRERMFGIRSAILEKNGKVINSRIQTDIYHPSFGDVLKFKIKIFVNSIGKYHFLWKYLAKIENVNKIVIE